LSFCTGWPAITDGTILARLRERLVSDNLSLMMNAANNASRKPATPAYWKTNEQVALLLLSRGIKNDVQARVLARVEARIETQKLLAKSA